MKLIFILVSLTLAGLASAKPIKKPSTEKAAVAESTCTSGALQCTDPYNGAGWEQCANGQWVQQNCGAGTVCFPYEGSIVCAQPGWITSPGQSSTTTSTSSVSKTTSTTTKTSTSTSTITSATSKTSTKTTSAQTTTTTLVTSTDLPLPNCAKTVPIGNAANAYDLSLQYDISLNSLVRLNGWWAAANAPFTIPAGATTACIDLAPTILPANQTVFTGAATYYDVSAGTTYCGDTHSNSDLVVAVGKWWMNHQGGTSNVCEKHVEISFGGKTVTAQVVDQCCICDDQDLDLSPALFEMFEPQSVGRFGYISWKFTDYSGSLNYNIGSYTCPL